ncbi:MAG TPA: MlaD family protein [Solirubrobacteraceae bacterium]|nr:MlaD family protein [Solirubrobacteraceae bacterium]
MRRALTALLVVAVATAGAVVAAGAGHSDDGRLTYRIVFDNAFGLVKQADFKVGGVAVGSIKDLDVKRDDARALVTVEATDPGFGGLQRDAQCMIEPQSLIGEYFVNCQPGKDPRALEEGATIPVEQTESPIPADLVTNIMRRPYRERFSIILSQLGAGLAARGGDLNDTIRRALPALQETRRVLKVLGDNRRTLRTLARDSGAVMKVLGERRRDVGRFVTESRDLAVATAERRDALAETFRRFPAFLDELEPTMNDLGAASRDLAPTFADLRVAAPSLTGLLRTLTPFARALEPATTSLGETGRTGRRAAREARSLVTLLRQLGRNSREPANNLDIVLADLDDRDRAIAPDPDSPEGKGYTGLEATLQYVFDQSLSLNLFDQRGYILKLNALINECTPYRDAEEAKEDPELIARCNQWLGPNQPGITTPDPSPPLSASAEQLATRKPARTRRGAGRDRGGPADARPTPAPQGDQPGAPKLPDLPKIPDLLEQLPDALKLGGTPQGGRTQDLLDFLLAP